ncbi:hypothetical protein WA026_014605 [Henosepilachna vigintioctopunctata]|uniref:Immunoglobulin V-set domain-containing protein n=1 Tax=Henosepilachna vigintioctopunctata TaxID=420089 RepID=A0AAW1V7T0_9CUCU
MVIQRISFFIYLCMHAFTRQAAGESSFNAFVGTTVALPCTVDTKQCGALHSVKWYRDMSRIYVFSHAGGIARAEGNATDSFQIQFVNMASNRKSLCIDEKVLLILIRKVLFLYHQDASKSQDVNRII